MFDSFQKSFSKDVNLSAAKTGAATRSGIVDVDKLLDELGGLSFDRGLYRLILPSEVSRWNDRLAVPFPAFGGRVICFGFDWLGRIFAADRERLEKKSPGVVMFEPGTGEALEIPCNVTTFHEEELLEYRDAALASDFHDRWLTSGGSVPEYSQCIGYKKPLFLGGSDELNNLVVSDIDVYWHLAGQLIGRTKGLPPGTPIQINQ